MNLGLLSQPWDCLVATSVAGRLVVEKALNAVGAPSASIWTIEEVIAHPQIIAREVMQSVQTQYGMLRLMGSGFQMAHGGGHLDTAPPELGADTDTILADLGYDEAAISGLRADGVI